MFIVHLLTRKRDKQDLSCRLADLPMTCSDKTRKRCLQSLHNLACWSTWRDEEDSGPFTITLAPEVAQRVVEGYYHCNIYHKPVLTSS